MTQQCPPEINTCYHDAIALVPVESVNAVAPFPAIVVLSPVLSCPIPSRSVRPRPSRLLLLHCAVPFRSLPFRSLPFPSVLCGVRCAVLCVVCLSVRRQWTTAWNGSWVQELSRPVPVRVRSLWFFSRGTTKPGCRTRSTLSPKGEQVT